MAEESVPQEFKRIIASMEYASEAFDDNILRLELLNDGASVVTAYNSKKEQTAQTYFNQGGVAHA